jgi:hypothetical protein
VGEGAGISDETAMANGRNGTIDETAVLGGRAGI